MLKINNIKKYIFSLLSLKDQKEIESIYQHFLDLKKNNIKYTKEETRSFINELKKNKAFSIYNNSSVPYFYKEYETANENITFILKGGSFLEEIFRLKLSSGKYSTFLFISINSNIEHNNSHFELEYCNFSFLNKIQIKNNESLSLSYKCMNSENSGWFLIENAGYYFLDPHYFINFLNSNDSNKIENYKNLEQSIKANAELNYLQTDKKADLNYYDILINGIIDISIASNKYEQFFLKKKIKNQ